MERRRKGGKEEGEGREEGRERKGGGGRGAIG